MVGPFRKPELKACSALTSFEQQGLGGTKWVYYVHSRLVFLD